MRTALSLQALKVSNALKAYASVTNITEISNFVITSESMLLESMRYQTLLEYCKVLQGYLKTHSKKLIRFGLTEDTPNVITELIETYEKSLEEPRELVNIRKTNNELLEDTIDEISKLLNEVIDPLVDILNHEKEFYLEYKSARMIVDSTGRRKEEEEQEVEEIINIEK